MSEFPETKEVPCPFCDDTVEIELIDPERGEYEEVPPDGHFCGDEPNMVEISGNEDRDPAPELSSEPPRPPEER
ncbi:hypothetical protein [Natronolimnobius baerhuensis]|uniref:hypothetical protein n=1 Tax=Natronolimnobius baerhuensis TaxID=253108 RepID=UPI0011251734|nr:hypothetical protein [Natronolimnobius baerhuensis]